MLWDQGAAEWQQVLPAAEGLARGFWPDGCCSVCLFAAWQRVIDAEPTMIIIIVVKLTIINLIQSLLLLLS